MIESQWFAERDAVWEEQQSQELDTHIDEEMDKISHHSRNYRKYQSEYVNCENKLKDKLKYNRKLLDYTFRTIIDRVVMVLLVWLVYAINLIMVYSPSEYLVKRSFGDSVLSHLLVFLVPLLLVLFELAVAYSVNRLAKLKKTNKKIFTDVIVWVTPMMFFATHLAEYEVKGKLPGLGELLLIGAQVFIAWITDAMIVMNYDGILEAYAFFWFMMSSRYTRNEMRQLAAKSRKAYLSAGSATDTYHDLIHQYNQAHPNSPYRRRPCDRHTEYFITEWSSREEDPPVL